MSPWIIITVLVIHIFSAIFFIGGSFFSRIRGVFSSLNVQCLFQVLFRFRDEVVQ